MRYRSAPRLNIGRQNGTALYRTGQNSIYPVSSEAAEILAGCRTFRCMEDHALSVAEGYFGRRIAQLLQMVRMSKERAQHLSHIFASKQRGGIRRSALYRNSLKTLERFRDSGFLIDETALNGVKTEEESNDCQSISQITIPTSGRPFELDRCLRAMAGNMKQHGHHCSLVVAEDEAEKEDVSRGILAGVADEYEMEAEFIGIREKERFCSRLAQEGIPEYISRFAVLGYGDLRPRMGANRNSLLLNSAGRMIFSCDDDTVARGIKKPVFPQKYFFERINPVETWYFRSREELLDSLDYDDIDVIGEHEKHLGQSLPAFVREEGPVIDEVCDHIIVDLLNRTGRIVTTMNGLCGDSGATSNAHVLFDSNPGTRKRLAQDQGLYDTALASREVIRYTPAVYIGHSLSYMSTMVGIDNRSLFPPFVPVCRGEDAVVGSIIGSGGAGAYFAYLPFGLLHLPAKGRAYRPTRIDRLCDMFRAIVLASVGNQLELDLASQIAILGKTCFGLGHLPLPEFQTKLCALLLEYRRIQLNIWMRMHDTVVPPYWRRDIVERIRECQNSLISKGYLTPIDLPFAQSAEGILLLQELIGLYGELLTWWPCIGKTARRLSDAGIRLGSPVRSSARSRD